MGKHKPKSLGSDPANVYPLSAAAPERSRQEDPGEATVGVRVDVSAFGGELVQLESLFGEGSGELVELSRLDDVRRVRALPVDVQAKNDGADHVIPPWDG